MYTHRLRLVRSGITCLLALSLSACGVAAPETTSAPDAAAGLPTATLAVPPAPAFTPTPEQPAAENIIQGPSVAFENIHFQLPADLGTAVQAQTIPPADRLGEIYPEYLEFLLVDATSINTWVPQPRIDIYPVAELGVTGTQVVQQLKDLLAGQPESLQAGLPILPPLPAGQLVDSQIEFLTFANGSGVRALTQFAQASWPVSNEGLVYVFQGLTSDERHYISAIMPVSAPFLADRVVDPAKVPEVDGVAYPEFNSPDFDSEYTRYREAIARKLDSTSPEEFSPALGVLDELIESFEIEPATTAPDPAAQACVNTLPTRLKAGEFAYVDPDPPLPNNLRRDAGKEQPLTGEIQPGQAMRILEGPECADGWVWWRVRTFDPELTGWTAEGDTETYWLIPCASRNECRP
jgi:hypothetical protein